MILLGARNLDPPETAFIAAAGIRTELGELPEHVYVALDGDVAEPGELDVFMPGARRACRSTGSRRSWPRCRSRPARD